MVTFRNNNNNVRRNNFRRNDRNFKSNGDRPKFASNYSNNDNFKRKFTGIVPLKSKQSFNDFSDFFSKYHQST